MKNVREDGKMAARADAAALCSHFQCFVLLFVLYVLLVRAALCRANITYSRQDLLKIGVSCEITITAESSRSHNIPESITRDAGSPWITIPTKKRRRRRERKQKRGCRAGGLARLRKRPHKPPLPSLSLANVRSLTNKMDELRLQAASDHFTRDCCVLLITETWLHSSIPDSAIELACFTTRRADRTSDSGKNKGGGLCIYINNNWCSNTETVASHCSPVLEYLTVKCRPFYLPREFTGVMLTVVYIPPDANASSALGLLHNNVSLQQNQHPDAVHIIAGDFNHVDLKSALPKLHQHVKCATRGANTLDKVYTNIKLGYRARPAPHLGRSDHISLQLIPAYTPLRKSTPTITKTIRTWPDGASQQLQDCFNSTDWDIFEDEDLDVFTDTVLCYIKNCVDTVTVEKRIRVYPNQKPWMTREVKQLLKDRNTAFRAGDRALYSIARANLKRGIRKAKADFRRRIDDHLDSNNSRQAWMAVQHLTNYKPGTRAAEGDAELAEELNLFFARFEAETPRAATSPPAAGRSPALTVGVREVRRTLMGVNPRKATGPDGVSGRVLKDCADQLAGIFTRIFNLSLTQSTVPSCLKTSTVIPLPKKSTITSLNDYRPVALTPVVMKCFEKLVRSHIMTFTTPSSDPYQFAYKANRSTEDAVNAALHTALSHLENQGNYARLLFVDFSSAFNTILPHGLVRKLRNLGLPHSTCLWIKDFLTERTQRVRIGPHTSAPLTLSTGSPQGCVLSPLLFTLYTSDCTPIHTSNTFIKYADDTTVVGCITGGDESAYRDEVQQLTVWCRDNNLLLNTSKTKELIIDYRNNKTDFQPLLIGGSCVERVSDFCFLGVHIEEKLTWNKNTTQLVKKAQKRLHFLRILRKNNINQRLLVSFYRSTMESILTYCLCTWFASCTVANRKALQRVTKMAEKVIGCPLPTLEDLHGSYCLRRANTILKDSYHPGHFLFKLLPSGKRYRAIKTRTNRLKNSFFPTAVRALNNAGL